jgi:hypothetical protein
MHSKTRYTYNILQKKEYRCTYGEERKLCGLKSMEKSIRQEVVSFDYNTKKLINNIICEALKQENIFFICMKTHNLEL